jgi:hypothetical protein
LSKKPVFWSKNPDLEGFGFKRGVYEHSYITENSEIVQFQTFRKLQKNDAKIEFRKSQKTRFDPKNGSNVWFKVWNT